ncbi:hypothetical protein LJR074_001204 [Acidovorax sp. LjRoot74]|uniref:hypothetical protein n=1 Tax=Acidovorax sp. LjRoot74 TaxID=3342337 RepID=UPI003ED13273
MLSFAALSVPAAPAKALGPGLAAGGSASGSLATYWPCELLNAFALKMAASGHCVNMSMMLGHRPYALEQLALARSEADGDLHHLAAQLQAYFDAPQPG